MCLAIFPSNPVARIAIEFALERIYLQRNGDADMTVDLLVQNIGDVHVGALRIVLPASLLDISPLSILRSDVEAEELAAKLRLEQRRLLRLHTNQMSDPNDPINWPYRNTLKHVYIDSKHVPGVFEIQRTLQRKGPGTLKGFIKNHWTVAQPTQFEDHHWTWLFVEGAGYTVLDIVAPKNSDLELLQSVKDGKPASMWLRLNYHIPAKEFNKKAFNRKWLHLSLPYEHVFIGHGHICKKIQNHFKEMTLEDYPQSFRKYFTESQGDARLLFNENDQSVEIRDWRVLVIREHGLTLKGIEHLGAPTPVTPPTEATLPLPPAADPEGCRRWSLPMFLHGLYAKRERIDTVDQFWTGTEHRDGRSKTPQDTAMTRIRTESRNFVYHYLQWISIVLAPIAFILGVLGVVLSILALR